MDWQLAITRNRDALLRILAALFALAGLTSPHRGQKAGETSGSPRTVVRRTVEGATTMSRYLHHTILAVLRPAESAVRRLIMIAARGINFEDSLLNSPIVVRSQLQWWKKQTELSPSFSTRAPSFCLIDPLKRFVPSATQADEETNFWNTDDEAHEDETAFIRSIPRISIPGIADPIFTTKPYLPDGLVNAQHLTRRLLALKYALDNLPNQARRLARWQAKRNFLRQKFPLRPLRLSPFRPGLPPGFRARQTHEVDDILKECQGLLMDLQADTS
jgi:hypothetical protein